MKRKKLIATMIAASMALGAASVALSGCAALEAVTPQQVQDTATVTHTIVKIDTKVKNDVAKVKKDIAKLKNDVDKIKTVVTTPVVQNVQKVRAWTISQFLHHPAQSFADLALVYGSAIAAALLAAVVALILSIIAILEIAHRKIVKPLFNRRTSRR